ncbi:MAG: putative peptidoglycan binding domain-containing protein, partial [Anaerolineae bacterium]|nr:putative peptidoglycan binding domain-containing protein [Anaerolineae bacterium]
DRYLDLRVDDHPQPIAELQRILAIHHLYFGAPDPDSMVPLAAVAADLQELLQRTGRYQGPITGVFDETTREALRGLVGAENLEERWDGTGEVIDQQVLDFLFGRF